MELVLKNIEKNNQISKQEFGQVVDLLYGSITISPKDDNEEIKKKEQMLVSLIALLNEYYEKQVWESDELEADFLDFLSKVQLQKEILHLATCSQEELKEIQLAINSFALKTQYPVGMR